jgi:mono/diheme cytochrome c family protein
MLAFAAVACSSESEATVDGRWYTPQQVDQGKGLYASNCVACHRPDAVGTVAWKKRDDAGNLPPPPLNGSAHAWHHPMEILLKTVAEGGAQWGGTMPPFKAILTESERKAVVAYFQSHWSDEIYAAWVSRN